MKRDKIISFSGGKDSTAMAILYSDLPLIFFDTGWEFPDMLTHVKKFNPIILHPKIPFDELVLKYKWPAWNRRWCTTSKSNALKKYCKEKIELIGFTIEEIKRTKSKQFKNRQVEFPLIDKNMTGQDSLNLCYKNRYNWNGLYEQIDNRISCFCCPLKGKPKVWKKIRKFYPELWDKMLWLDSKIKNNGGFYGYMTVRDLEKQFIKEDQVNERIINFCKGKL